MQNTNDEMSQSSNPPGAPELSGEAEARSNEPMILRTAREAKHLSTGDVAYALKVSPRVIEALEAGAWDKLPGRTFVVGILRAYGRLLDVSVDTLVEAVPGVPAAMKKNVAATQTGEKSSTAKTPSSSSRDRETKRQSNRMLKFGLVMILIAVVLAYAIPRETMETLLQDGQSLVQRLTGNKAPELPGAADETQPVAPAEQAGSTPAAPAEQQAQTGTGTLELRFSAPAWVEVRDHTGRIIYSQLNAAGTTQFITGAAPLDVMIGNAKQVQARWRDEPLKLDKLSGDDVARQTLR